MNRQHPEAPAGSPRDVACKGNNETLRFSLKMPNNGSNQVEGNNMLISSPQDIASQARFLVQRYGVDAAEIATRRAAERGRAGDLRGQDEAYLLLSEIERLTRPPESH